MWVHVQRNFQSISSRGAAHYEDTLAHFAYQVIVARRSLQSLETLEEELSGTIRTVTLEHSAEDSTVP